MITNGQIVAVNFIPGAGGKFIQNCLALSKHCVLKHADWTDWQLAQCEYDAAFYQQKLNWAASTVAADMAFWQQRELGDEQYFGRLFLASTVASLTSNQLPNRLHRAAEQNLWTTYSAHNHSVIEDYLGLYWPTVKVVNVWPAIQFLKQWLPKKNQNMWQGFAHLTDIDYDNYRGHSPKDKSFWVDMDNTIYNETAFLTQMDSLYTWLGWDDFAAAPIVEFYRLYRNTHQ